MAAALVLVVLLAACGGGDGSGRLEWRGLELTVPDGWVVFENRPTLLSIANAPLGEEAGDPGERTVAVQFAHRGSNPQTAADVREFVAEQEGELEVDESITVGGRPAHRFVYTFDANGTPTREMVVLVPARQLDILLQPVPRPGQTSAPDVFLDFRGRFDELVASIEFGAPPEGP